MKARRKKRLTETIEAAGGIVVTSHRPPLVAVVQRRKDDGWVLPKGKLKARETAFAAAQREASEETGHSVIVHDYLGAVSYQAGNRPKVVQFWRMAAAGATPRKPMRDIKAVKWLPLQDALARLSHPLERAFLAQIGERGLLPPTARRLPSPRAKLRKAPARNKVRHESAGTPPEAERNPDAFAGANIIRRLIQRLQNSRSADAALS